MISGAFLDPGHGYRDPVLNEFVERFRALLDDPAAGTAQAAALALAYVGKTRRQSDQLPRVHFDDTVVDYRDDNRHLWLYIEDSDDEDFFYNPDKQLKKEAEVVGLSPRHYPEWDHGTQTYRPDWASVYEALHPSGNPGDIDRLLAKHAALAKHLKRLLDLLKPQEKVRIRYQEEGSEWDLDVALRALIEFKGGVTPDPRINMSHRTDGRNVAVLLLQVANITAFVERGGGLILTGATSLYDENGSRRSDFALGGVAGIRHLEPGPKLSESIKKHQTYGGVWDLYLKTRPGQDAIKPPLKDRLLPTHLYETVDVLPGGTVVADLVSGSDQQALVPGVVVSRRGKGRVAYLAAASEALYYQTSIRELADIVKQVIEYVSPEGLPYKIEAPPSSLITNLTVKGDTGVLHLVNLTGSRDERILQNLYHLPPVEDITIEYGIPAGKKLKGIHLLVPAEYIHQTVRDVVRIHRPKIEKYQAVAIEIE